MENSTTFFKKEPKDFRKGRGKEATNRQRKSYSLIIIIKKKSEFEPRDFRLEKYIHLC